MIRCEEARALRMRWLSGEAPSARTALGAHAAACPHCGEALARQLAEDEALSSLPWEEAAHAAAPPEGFAAKVLQALPRTASGRLLPPAAVPGERWASVLRADEAKRRRFLRVWGAAASVALVLGLGAWGLGARLASRIELAEVLTISGEAWGKRLPWERLHPLAPGDRLAVGSRLETGRGALRLRFPDGSLVDLGPASALRLEGPRAARLDRGRSRVQASKAEAAWVMETPEGRVRTLGTGFSVALEESGKPATASPAPPTSPPEGDTP